MNQLTKPHCVITAGPTYESLDQVRRLTNFSTGSLGTQLSGFLRSKGFYVTLLTGHYTTYEGIFDADTRIPFTTTEDLAGKLRDLSKHHTDAIFHAAAVSDFTFGKIWKRSERGEMKAIDSGKISTRSGTLLAELVPTPKILAELRNWYPKALSGGWNKEPKENVFMKKKIPFRSFNILKRDEKTLGELFIFFILETILLGKAMNVNPFDQPLVELIKF